VTVDRDGIEGDGETVTVRERDTAAQVRVPAGEVAAEIAALTDPDAERTFAALRDDYAVVASDAEP